MANSRKADRMQKEFGVRLRAARISAGYKTADDFAQDLGVDGPRYRRYERGQSMPPLDILERASELTRKSADFLLFGRPNQDAAD